MRQTHMARQLDMLDSDAGGGSEVKDVWILEHSLWRVSSIYRRIMPDALIKRQATQVMLHLWQRIPTTWHLTVFQCSSGNCCSHVHSNAVPTVIKIITLHVINPLVRIRLTKTTTQSLITIITHYTGKGQPPVLSISVTSPLACEAPMCG